jgi:hypothetical protein
VSFCPKCRHEYAETVEKCIDCGLPLRKGRRPVSVDLELGDLLIPVGALFCAIVAVGMLYLRVAAQFGWITGPFAQLVLLGQPPIMTVFYAIAAIASIIVCAMWCIQVFVRRG